MENQTTRERNSTASGADFWERRARAAEEQLKKIQEVLHVVQCDYRILADNHYKYIMNTQQEKKRLTQKIIDLAEELRKARGGEGGEPSEPAISTAYKDIKNELHRIRRQNTYLQARDIRQSQEIKRLRKEKNELWRTIAACSSDKSATSADRKSTLASSDPANTTSLRFPNEMSLDDLNTNTSR